MWHVSLVALVIGLLWAGVGFSLWHDYREAEHGAARDTANLALAFEEDIARTVEAADQMLLFVREAYRHDRAGFLRGTWTAANRFTDDLHMQIAVTNRDGDIVWSSLGPVPGTIDIAGRDHFQAQKASLDDHLVIGRPVLGRVSHKWSIQFVRKLLAADGTFDGIAVVSLDPSYLSRLYESISIGNGSVLLASTGGVILARAPGGGQLIGRDLPADTTVRLLRLTAGGAFRAVSVIDGIDRIFSSRRLAHYPLVLSVGLAAEDVFAPFERNRRLYLAAGVLLSLGCVAVGEVLRRQRLSLLDSRQALAATLDNMSQGIAMVRADGSIPVLNRRAIDLLGLRPALLSGRPAFQRIIEWQYAHGEFGPPGNRDTALESQMQRTAGLHGDFTYVRTRPNGTVLEVRTLAVPGGGIIRTFTDITERTRQEAALEAAQARAVHAERMQALGQLAGGIAHDFNNVLQVVQGGAALIGKRASDAGSVRRFARMIMDAAERGSSIARRLLAFARRGELRTEAVEAGVLLPGLRDVLNHTLGSGIAVHVRLADALPPLMADKGQLETALVNLATNARDAMPDGGSLVLAARAETVEEQAAHLPDLRAGQYVRLSVADTGIGMDDPLRGRALEPFFSTKPPGQGTGLGLSMAKGFAEQSGGALAIESAPGLGTTVHLWFPVAGRAAAPEMLDVAMPVDRPDPGRRVLLVDGEAMVRETLATALAEAGYGVVTVADGAAALEVLGSAAAVDVLVADLSMPGIDGLAVLLTGYAGHGAQLAVGGSVKGPFALVRKPVTAAQLADRIEALLAAKRADESLASRHVRFW